MDRSATGGAPGTLNASGAYAVDPPTLAAAIVQLDTISASLTQPALGAALLVASDSRMIIHRCDSFKAVAITSAGTRVLRSPSLRLGTSPSWIILRAVLIFTRIILANSLTVSSFGISLANRVPPSKVCRSRSALNLSTAGKGQASPLRTFYEL